MPDCHNCPLDGSGSDECLRCTGPADTNHHGKTHVSWEAVESFEGSFSYGTDHIKERAIIIAFSHMILLLEEKTRNMLFRRIAGEEYKTISRHYGISPQAVELRLTKAMRDSPAIRDMLADKLEKQKRRKTNAVP